ncbi:MAG TPA: tetratricopeptide repeat protein [Pseudomonadales bacterium]
MWKVFISGVLALALAGCAARGPQSPAVSDDIAAHAEAAAAEPAPEVRGDNAELFERAVARLVEGRLAEAEALLLEVTEDQPELAGPWVNLAQVYQAQGREDEAIAALEQAVLANPGNCAAHTELGVLLRRRGEFDGAEAHYLACLERHPDYPAAQLNLGILYDLYLGRWDRALEAYRRYQSLVDEPDKRVHAWVVDLERRLGAEEAT